MTNPMKWFFGCGVLALISAICHQENISGFFIIFGVVAAFFSADAIDVVTKHLDDDEEVE